jgi:dTMP kinase
LLGHETGVISPRAEALLYAADRAHHVFSTIRPALDRGDVVITDRYFDSSIAYQGAGRVLQPGEVARISRWATESLFPTLTILIDQSAEVGLGRLKSRDRLEAEPNDFHERVRQEFLQLAAQDPERYLVVDGTQTIDEIHEKIIERVALIPTMKAIVSLSQFVLQQVRWQQVSRKFHILKSLFAKPKSQKIKRRSNGHRL